MNKKQFNISIFYNEYNQLEEIEVQKTNGILRIYNWNDYKKVVESLSFLGIKFNIKMYMYNTSKKYYDEV
jgi:hypothetical protein